MEASDYRLATPEETAAACRASFERLAEQVPYLGPLLEATLVNNGVAPFRFSTLWGGDITVDCTDLNPEKHELYSAHIKATVNEKFPLFLPLLEKAGASVIVMPGFFNFMLPVSPPMSFDIGALVPFTYLTPWVDPAEPVSA